MASHRLLACLLLLQGKRRITARELAAQLEVSMRTIYRDVEALGAAGVPIHMERGPLGGIVLADDYRRALAQFTNDELQALFATGPGPMGDLGMTHPGQALQKLAGALPATQRRAIETGRDRLFLDHNRWSRGVQPIDILRRLRGASERDRRVRLGYRDRGGALTERRLDPLGLVAKAGVWYLVAHEAEKGYRTFRAQRIEAVEELPEGFVRPPGFNLEAYWSESVVAIERQSQMTYDVVLRMAPETVFTFSAYWNVTSLHDDGAETTVTIAFPSENAAIVQILALAGDVRLLSPDDLAAKIVRRASAAIAAFS